MKPTKKQIDKILNNLPMTTVWLINEDGKYLRKDCVGEAMREGFSLGQDTMEKKVTAHYQGVCDKLNKKIATLKETIREYGRENLRLKQDNRDMQRWLDADDKEIADLKDELKKWKTLYGDNHYEKQLAKTQEKLTEASFNLKGWKARSKEFEEGYYEKSNALADTKGQLAKERKKADGLLKELSNSIYDCPVHRRGLVRKFRSRKQGIDVSKIIDTSVETEKEGLVYLGRKQRNEMFLGVDMVQGKEVTVIDELKIKGASLTPEGVVVEGEIIKSHKKKGSELLTTTNPKGKTSNKNKSTSEKGTTNKQKAGEKK